MSPKYDLPISFGPWHVPDTGFAWVPGRSKVEDPVRNVLAPRVGSRTTRTDPAGQAPALYRVFADTPGTPDGFLGFANIYGTLGMTLDALGWHEGRPFEPAGELADDAELGPVVGLEPGELAVLDRAYDRFPGPAPFIAQAVQAALEGFERHKRRYADPLPVWDEEHRRMKQAVGLLDQDLAGPTSPSQGFAIRMLAYRALTGRDVGLVLARERSTKKLALHIQPRSLLALMWVQFALAVGRSRDHRQCDGCGSWFEVSADGHHGNRHYCGDTCKTRAYRKRKARAVELAASGMPLKDIAKEVESDPATVKGWIAEVKNGDGRRTSKS